jgi:hypothetical protein
LNYANIEPKVYKTAIWLLTYLPEYLALASAELATWPSDTDFPSAFDMPDENNTPLAIKKASVGVTVPKAGPFPYLLLVLDNVGVEWSGQNSDIVTLNMKVILAVQENSERRIGVALMRYMDALTMAIGKNVTLNGLFNEIKLTMMDVAESPETRAGFMVADLVAKYEITCE